MELNKTVALKYKLKKEFKDLLKYKQFISLKNISLKDKKGKENKKDANLFLTENNFDSLTKINKKKTKVMLIKSFLTPTIKETIFDGYAVNRKKYSFEELIKKVSQKEKKEILEKNKLFKRPYPLIKFLSNRKLYNNTSSLLCELLDNDISKLTKEQLLVMNKKDENKKNMNYNNLSYSYKYFNENNKSQISKKKKYNSLDIKRNIRLFDYLKSKNKLICGERTNYNFKDKDFMIGKFQKEKLPFLHRYIKDKSVNTNTFNKDNMIFKNSKLNKTEKTIYLNTELDIIINKLKKGSSSNNSSINKERNNSFKIRSSTNYLSNKSIKDNSYQTYFK